MNERGFIGVAENCIGFCPDLATYGFYIECASQALLGLTLSEIVEIIGKLVMVLWLQLTQPSGAGDWTSIKYIYFCILSPISTMYAKTVP